MTSVSSNPISIDVLKYSSFSHKPSTHSHTCIFFHQHIHDKTTLKPSYALTLTENPISKMATYEENVAIFLKLGFHEATAKALATTAVKSLEKELLEWKISVNYGDALKKIKSLEKKLEVAKNALPEIPEKFKKKSKVGTMLDRSVIQDKITKTKGKKITTTALSNDEDDHRSKHLPAKNAKQERKDFNDVVISTRNIACPNGNGTDGTVRSAWTKRYEALLENPVQYFKDGTSKDYSAEVLKQRPSTNTRGCRYMCRTKKTMANHLLTCKHK